jgi:hypothetical protein
VDSLGRIADGIRQLATDFGLRPYRCFLVTVDWTGRRRGEGTAQVTARGEILPTPKIRDTTAMIRDVDTGGTKETGGVRLERVTMLLDEFQILGRGPDGKVFPNRQTFIEVVEDGSVTKAARRRRFAVKAVPFLRRGGTSWTVPLERQYENLNAEGNPVGNV